jgi:hypothetical protein
VLPFLLIVSSSSGAFGIDPGTAKGTMRVGDDTITLTHAYALVHDNAEGVLDGPRHMRILAVDREMKPDVLHGLVFLPVMTLAREGKVRGLLLTFRPDDLTQVQVTMLYPPAGPMAMLISQSRMDTGGVVKNFKLGDQRVVGAIEETAARPSPMSDAPPITYAATFSAPIFNEPKVTEDLKGPAATNSPQLEVLRASAAALRKADFDGVRKTLTPGASAQLDMMIAQGGDQVAAFARQAGSDMAKSVETVQRVVVRGTRAVAIFGDKSWRNLERIGADWKVAE